MMDASTVRARKPDGETRAHPLSIPRQATALEHSYSINQGAPFFCGGRYMLKAKHVIRNTTDSIVAHVCLTLMILFRIDRWL